MAVPLYKSAEKVSSDMLQPVVALRPLRLDTKVTALLVQDNGVTVPSRKIMKSQP